METQLMTAAELAALPGDARYELVKGILCKKPFTGFQHGVVAWRLALRLGNYVEARQLGAVCGPGTGFWLATEPDTVRTPDISFVRQACIEAIGIPDGYWPGAPDLAAEVVEPTDTYTEVAEKARAWIAAGTQLVLVVDPDPHTVTVYRSLTDIADLGEAGTIIGDPIVPGWTLPVRDLFA